jgi:hypothetical protein
MDRPHDCRVKGRLRKGLRRKASDAQQNSDDKPIPMRHSSPPFEWKRKKQRGPDTPGHVGSAIE